MKIIAKEIVDNKFKRLLRSDCLESSVKRNSHQDEMFLVISFALPGLWPTFTRYIKHIPTSNLAGHHVSSSRAYELSHR